MEPVAGISFAPPPVVSRSARPALALLVSSLLFAMVADVVAGLRNQPEHDVGLAVRVEFFLEGAVSWSATVATGLLLAARVQLALAAMWLATTTTLRTEVPERARRLRAAGLLSLCGLLVRWSLASSPSVVLVVGSIVDGVLWALCVVWLAWSMAQLCPASSRGVWRGFALVVIAALLLAWLDQTTADLGLFDSAHRAERERRSTIAEFDQMTTTGWLRWSWFVVQRLGIMFVPSTLLLVLAGGALVGVRDVRRDDPRSDDTTR